MLLAIPAAAAVVVAAGLAAAGSSPTPGTRCTASQVTAAPGSTSGQGLEAFGARWDVLASTGKEVTNG
jgi:hypothetical protein